ncbi:MAG TPA: hypothetical protein VK864_10795 [Longimicrobiales bacterium]|nr:hypothetical protein [Longimicrobiales bacterium]
MSRGILLLVAIGATTLAGCAKASTVLTRTSPSRTVVVSERVAAPRALKVPPGHYPPRGQCRLWYPGRPPGHQPSPGPCSQFRGVAAGSGAFILYNGNAWDSDYDWRAQERRKPNSVPVVIVQLTSRAR